MSRPYGGLVIVGVLAAAVFWTVAAFLGVHDLLRADVATVLTPTLPPAEDPNGMSLTIVHGAPTGVARGMQLAMLALLVGALPLAVAGWFLASRVDRFGSERRAAFATLFLAGFVFQLGSLPVTFIALMFAVITLIISTTDSEVPSLAAAAATLVLLVSFVGSAFAVRMWHRLLAPASLSGPLVGSRLGRAD